MILDSYEDDNGFAHLELIGVVHQVYISEQPARNYDSSRVFIHTLAAHNGFNLDQQDVNALYKFLAPLVTEE